MGWVQFSDEKCYRILDDSPRSYSEAQLSCSNFDSGATLPIVQSQEEQDFLANYLFNISRKVDNFWIGAMFVNSSFYWSDGSQFFYTNWDGRNPRNRTNYCVQMQFDDASLGKWLDDPCDKKYAVICEKRQIWSLTQMQKSFLDTKKALNKALSGAIIQLNSAHAKILRLEHSLEVAIEKNDVSNGKIENLKEKLNLTNGKVSITKQKLDRAEAKLDDANAKMANLKQNLIPIGFIYTELPNSQSPTSLWPWMSWTDVSSSYGGLFFRVEGGEAAPFGQVQSDNDRALVGVQNTYDVSSVFQYRTMHSTSSSTQASEWIWSGDIYPRKDKNCHLRFITTKGEVRPRNMAIRVWKRIA